MPGRNLELEFAAARRAAAAANVDADDVEFARHYTGELGADGSSQTWDIIAARRSTKRTRTYPNAQVGGWIREFEEDLRNKLFD